MSSFWPAREIRSTGIYSIMSVQHKLPSKPKGPKSLVEMDGRIEIFWG